jgi:accessory Sec system S-layer assembly protein
MLSFFRKKNEKIEKTGGESIVNSNDLLGDKNEVPNDIEVLTSLSFHPEAQVSTEERYYFQFLNNELPPLKENQISLSGIEIRSEEQEWQVVAFVRNSLSRPVKFERIPILLIGPNGEKIGRKIFPMDDLGEIPPKSSRPWIFAFRLSELYLTEIPEKGWKLAFELTSKNRLDLDTSWEERLTDQEKKELAQLVDSLEPPKPGEINFMGYNAEQLENGDLQVSILIRNGGLQDIQFENLPLIVEDASGDVVSKGSFRLENLVIKAETSKPWTFVFPKNLVSKEVLDLSTWKAYPPQKK